MITHRTPCTCEGRNPDCFRCYGSGLMSKIAQKRFVRLKITKMIKKKLKTDVKLDVVPIQVTITQKKLKKCVCNICKEEFQGNDDAYWQHLKMHNLVKCTICNSVVSEKNLERHINKQHRNNSVVTKTKSKPGKVRNIRINNTIYTLPLALPLRARPSITNTVRCPNCALLMLKNQLMDHLLTVHKRSDETVTLPVITTAFTGKSKYSAKPSCRPSDQAEGVSKKQDATYGYHVIREHGRFGSHPSHDSFDDDSGS